MHCAFNFLILMILYDKIYYWSEGEGQCLSILSVYESNTIPIFDFSLLDISFLF